MGNNVIFVPECHSTNSLLLKRIREESLPEGTVIITDAQTRGRGQQGNSWEAEPGQNITASILLRPGFLSIKDQFYLTIVTALAIADFIKPLSAAVSIKWPNDILIGEKKICGILIENQLLGSAIQTAVVGIGFNVNQQNFSLHTATSLSLVAGIKYPLPVVLENLLSLFESRYLQLRRADFDQLKADYLSLLFGREQRRKFLVSGELVEGIIKEVDASGKLQIEVNGLLQSFNLKEIQYQF